MSFNNVITVHAPDEDPTAIDLKADAGDQRIHGTTYHGNIDFRCPAWSYIDQNLWQGGYVHGLELSPQFKHLISLYPWEKYPVRKRLITELYVTMFDDTEQGLDQVDSLARLVNTCRETGPVLVHCQAGLNRSSLIVARALYLSGDEAFDTGDKIVDYLRVARSPAALCNPAFEAEVRSWRRSRRWITVGWSKTGPYAADDEGRYLAQGPHEAVMSLNGKPRAYYDLEQARRNIGNKSRDARIVELDFSESSIEARWVDEQS
jgi:protein-tyrosine phosphatase